MAVALLWLVPASLLVGMSSGGAQTSAPYGSWPSPLTAARLAGDEPQFDALLAHRDTLYGETR